MSIYGCNMNLELQQRAVEYNLVIRKYDNLREGLFEQMPPLEMRANINLPNGEEADAASLATGNEHADANEASLLGDGDETLVKQKQKEDATKTLLDLFDDDSGPVAPAITTNTNKTSNADILDLMSNDTPATAATATSKLDLIKQINSKQNQNQNSANNLDSLFGGSVGQHQQQTGASNANANSLDIFDLLGGGAGGSGATTQNWVIAQSISYN